jgi:hypothetical protein
MRCDVRRRAVIAALAVMAAAPVFAQEPAAPAEAPTTLSLTVRVTPANVWKVVGDLRQIMSEGPQSQAGPLLLRDLLGVISAEVGIDHGQRAPAAPSGVHVSSEPLTRGIRQGGFGAAKEQWTREQQRIGSQAAESGLTLERAVAGTAKAVETNAAKARQAADALASGIAGLKDAWLAKDSQPSSAPSTSPAAPPERRRRRRRGGRVAGR